MAEITISVASKIADFLDSHARYLFCFKSVVKSLRAEKENLMLTRDCLQQRAKNAKNKARKVEPAVENWLQDVEISLQQVHKLEAKLELSNSCFGGFCHYFLAKKLAKWIEKMIKLNEKSQFKPFSQPTELPAMNYFSSKCFFYFKSTESAYNELMEALKDSNTCMMGLHGMGGSGKTSLVKEVAKMAENFPLFHKVVIAVVSQAPNVRNIQGQIADQLGLKLGEESEFSRAQRLSNRLENGKILIILDDVWEKLDFEAIGVPSNGKNKGCRVLITTQIQRVCVSMGCTKITKLSLLNEEEAWFLFKLHADIGDDCPDDFKFVARKVSLECQGLPIAIVTVGRTLRRKSFEKWKLAWSRLRESQPVDIEAGLRSPYACLRLGYDNLRNQSAKSLFLLCSMFPEVYKINKEDLFRYWKELLVSGESLGEARREMNVAVNTLLDSNLLMPTDNKQCVKMHDLVRDVALWIASEECQAVMAATSKDARLLIEDETMSQKAKISLWEMVNGQLSDQLNFPKLDTLLLHSKDVKFEVANADFGGMKALKVLAFIRFSYSWHVYQWGLTSVSSLSIPQSIKSLTSLGTLCLRGYKLGDISILENLKGLEILDLRGSSFDELPSGIAELKKLKLLDLFNCSIAKNNPYEVTERLSQLEELYIWTNRNHPLENVSFPTLRRYAIGCNRRPIYTFASNPYEFLERYMPARAFCIEDFDVSSPNYASSSVKDLLPRVESLHLRHLTGSCKNIIPSMDKSGMNHLIGLILESCSEIECLVDSNRNTNSHMNLFPKEAVFSELVAIRLQHMNRLEEVFRDPSSSCSLKNLEEVRINYCPRLYSISFPRNSNLSSLKILRLERCDMLMSSIFTPSIAQTLVQLEHMNICECNRLKHIMCEVEEEEIADSVSSIRNYSVKMLPNLRILSVEGCESLESTFPIYFAKGLDRLEDVIISRIPKLKYIFGTHKEDQIEMDIDLPSLRRITLNSLTSLIDYYPKHCHPRSPNLKELSATAVHKMMIGSDIQQDQKATKEREIFWMVDAPTVQWCKQDTPAALQPFLNFQLQVKRGSDSYRERELLSLENLSVQHLSELQFKNGLPKYHILPKLRFVVLDTCPKLKNIFSVTIIRSLPKLESLKISNCEELEQIVSSDSDSTENDIKQFVCFPELRYLELLKCNKLKCLSNGLTVSHFPKLSTLKIMRCSQLDHGFHLERKANHRGSGRGQRAKNVKQVVFPRLEEIELVCLLNFTEICQGFKLQQPLKSYTVKDCPKYIIDRRSYTRGPIKG